jgi:putative endonuclease
MYVYILTNPGKNVFYTGVTNNLKRRLREHEKNKGNDDTFTGKYYCYKLIYFEEIEDPKEAIDREKEIKKLSRDNKLKLIKKKNPKLHVLII